MKMNMKKVYIAVSILAVLCIMGYLSRGRIRGILMRWGIGTYYTKKVKEFNAMPRTTG